MTVGDRISLPSPLPPVTVGAVVLWLLRRRKRFRIRGASMAPVLNPGQEILVDMNAYRRHQPTVGEIVVACHPQRPDVYVIKRITQIHPPHDGDPQPRYWLEGDNRDASTDSRVFGAVAGPAILGKVICRFF